MDELVRSLLEQGPVVGVLLFVLVGFVKEWWILGGTYRRCEEDRAKWEERYLRALTAGEKAVTVAAKTVRKKRVTPPGDDL